MLAQADLYFPCYLGAMLCKNVICATGQMDSGPLRLSAEQAAFVTVDTLRVNHQSCMDLLSQSWSELKTLASSCFGVPFKSNITFKFPME